MNLPYHYPFVVQKLDSFSSAPLLVKISGQIIARPFSAVPYGGKKKCCFWLTDENDIL